MRCDACSAMHAFALSNVHRGTELHAARHLWEQKIVNYNTSYYYVNSDFNSDKSFELNNSSSTRSILLMENSWTKKYLKKLQIKRKNINISIERYLWTYPWSCRHSNMKDEFKDDSNMEKVIQINHCKDKSRRI